MYFKRPSGSAGASAGARGGCEDLDVCLPQRLPDTIITFRLPHSLRPCICPLLNGSEYKNYCMILAPCLSIRVMVTVESSPWRQKALCIASPIFEARWRLSVTEKTEAPAPLIEQPRAPLLK